MSASEQETPAVKDGWAVKHGAVSQSVVKETVSRSMTCESHHGAPEVVHFLCLDVEGAEPEILGAFDFDGPGLFPKQSRWKKSIAMACSSPPATGRCGTASCRQVRMRMTTTCTGF